MKEFTRIDEEIKNLTNRIHPTFYFIICIGIIIIFRFWYLQIYHGDEFRQYSENNRLKKQNIEAPRGFILSRNNKEIANNYYEFSCVIIPQYIKNIRELVQNISKIVQIPEEVITTRIEDSKKQNGIFFPITIKKKLLLEEIYQLKILQLSFPELRIQRYISRFYPEGESLAQLVGYTSEVSRKEIHFFQKQFSHILHPGDTVGKSGVEQVFELDLRGQDGVSFIEVDAYSRNTLHPTRKLWDLEGRNPVSGKHLILTIDKDIQEAALKAMNRKDKIGPRKGAVVALKTNGEILAWLSRPSFDPNIFSHTISDDYWNELKDNKEKPMLNRVIQSHYSPGSTIKPFLILAALEKGLISESTKINSPGRLRVGRRYFHDYKRSGYGHIDLFEAIEQSANTFFYQLGKEVSFDDVESYLRLFGFGEKTDISLTGEITGLLPTTKWKAQTFNQIWQPGENLVHFIGQGYTLVTPLQLAVAFNAIATEGLMVRPFLVKKIINSENKVIKEFEPKIKQNLNGLLKPENFKIIKNALLRVVHGNNGTARWWKLRKHKMAGKTGTTQVRSLSSAKLYSNCDDRPMHERHHGWFVAFAPFEKPEIVVSVLTENSCSGASGSVPIARDIIQAYLNKYSYSNQGRSQ